MLNCQDQKHYFKSYVFYPLCSAFHAITLFNSQPHFSPSSIVDQKLSSFMSKSDLILMCARHELNNEWKCSLRVCNQVGHHTVISKD